MHERIGAESALDGHHQWTLAVPIMYRQEMWRGMKQLCPVCEGRGLVPPGFYQVSKSQYVYTLANAAAEKCRTCKGDGVIEDKSNFT